MSEYYDLGNQALENEDLETAVENFKLAAESGIKGAAEAYHETLVKQGEAINKLGDQLYKKKAFKEAMTYYQKSIAIMEEAGKEKRVKNFTNELNKATEKLGQEINNKGDKLYKDKKYEEAVEVYKESVLLMMEAGNEKKVANFRKELVNALTKLCLELIEKAANLAKEENIDDAIKVLNEARNKAKVTKDDQLIKRIDQESIDIYEKAADSINNKGDKLFKQKKYSEAVKLYKQSVTLIKKAGNDKKEKNYKKELAKAFKEHAEEINAAGDKAYKEGDYETAIDIYQESVEAAEAADNKKLVENFTKELEKSFEKYAKEINEKGDKLFKDKEYEKAAITYVKSIEIAQGSKKDKLVNNFTDELRKTYENWAESLADKGDDLFKQKKYEDAMPLFEEAVTRITTTGQEKSIVKYQKRMVDAYAKWAKEINEEGDKAYKMQKYEEAYGLYQKSVELAEKAGDVKLVNKFRKERDKALKKLQ